MGRPAGPSGNQHSCTARGPSAWCDRYLHVPAKEHQEPAADRARTRQVGHAPEALSNQIDLHLRRCRAGLRLLLKRVKQPRPAPSAASPTHASPRAGPGRDLFGWWTDRRGLLMWLKVRSSEARRDRLPPVRAVSGRFSRSHFRRLPSASLCSCAACLIVSQPSRVPDNVVRRTRDVMVGAPFCVQSRARRHC